MVIFDSIKFGVAHLCSYFAKQGLQLSIFQVVVILGIAP